MNDDAVNRKNIPCSLDMARFRSDEEERQQQQQTTKQTCCQLVSGRVERERFTTSWQSFLTLVFFIRGNFVNQPFVEAKQRTYSYLSIEYT